MDVVRARARVRIRIRGRIRCFVVTGGHKGVLHVRQGCGRGRQSSGIWAVAGRELGLG